MSFASPRSPISIDSLLPDQGLIRALIERGSPYFSVQRYVRNLDELRALSESGQDEHEVEPHRPMMVAPWFRGDWVVHDRAPLEGVEPILHHPALIAAASKLMECPVVAPALVYANLNPPLPKVDPGHVDVPTFWGADRRTLPIWLLQVMQKSELFTAWYVPTATAVAWYYEGEGGGFTYWPDGPDAPPRSRPCQSNSALVGDNDFMFHAVEAIGGAKREVPMGLTLDATLVVDESVGGYRLEDRDEDGGRRTVRTYAREDVRISISWKALCFASEAERERFERDVSDPDPEAPPGTTPLSRERILSMFVADLRERGVRFEVPASCTSDRSFIALLTRTYRRGPTVFAAA